MTGSVDAAGHVAEDHHPLPGGQRQGEPLENMSAGAATAFAKFYAPIFYYYYLIAITMTRSSSGLGGLVILGVRRQGKTSQTSPRWSKNSLLESKEE